MGHGLKGLLFGLVGLAAVASCSSSEGASIPLGLQAVPSPTVVVLATVTPVPPASPAIEQKAPVSEPAPTPRPWYPADSIGQPYSEAVDGVLTFRGSPTRSYYGRGPVPSAPTVRWSYPDRAMCSQSSDLEGTREWCGTGWTGQPAVWSRSGQLWLAFGAYDRQVHVLDAITGEPLMAPFLTGDLIKGSVTVDPDGHPLIYVGSRDNFLRVLSFDTGELRELWSLDARSIVPSRWNDDWDGAPIVLDDHLFVGGENSNFHVLRLNRSYDAAGNVAVAPDLLAVVPGWDEELIDAVGGNVSIENSVTIVDNIVYFANSGGLVQGWDIEPIRRGEQPEQSFRFWMGDDTDATLVVDDEGYLYAAAEYERSTERSSPSSDTRMAASKSVVSSSGSSMCEAMNQVRYRQGDWGSKGPNRRGARPPGQAADPGSLPGWTRGCGYCSWTTTKSCERACEIC